jgi:hypothetical protein
MLRRSLDMVEREKKSFIKEGSHVTGSMVIMTPKVVIIRTISALSVIKWAIINMHFAARNSGKRRLFT